MAGRACVRWVARLALLGLALSAPQEGKGKGKGKGKGTGGGSGGVCEYDYIVVGSGPGGGPLASNLARAGFSVLLLEAGDDQSADPSTHILSLSVPTPQNRWDFFVRHYDDDDKQLVNNHFTWQKADGGLWIGNQTNAPAGATPKGVYYPRGATLGGSSVINAAGAVLPSRNDWDSIGALTGDSTWSADNFRSIFERIENNHYLLPGTVGHGFNGWLNINSNNGSIWPANPNVLKVFESMSAQLGGNPTSLLDELVRDNNRAHINRDKEPGFHDLPFHVNGTWGRSSARNYILETLFATDANGGKLFNLKVKTNSLATKVLFAPTVAGQPPRATGVEFLQGTAMYSADPRFNASVTGTLKTARARREVILSGGVFNTPQLLLLSGIGNATELAALNITVVQNLPGVGRRLQDNYEMPIVGVAKEAFVTIPDPNDPVCTFGVLPDPCLEAFQFGLGPYARPGLNAHSFLMRTNFSQSDDVDMFIFTFPAAFRGFTPMEAESGIPVDPPGTFGLSMVKLNPQNKAGYVKLKSANPQDMPDINFESFGEGADIDLGAMSEAIAWGRRVHAGAAAPVGPMESKEPPCSSTTGPAGCVEGDKQWVRDQAFGHHATSTAAIGADNDPLAVLDSKFRVRGVAGLRVVDASAFPKTPGAFPVLSTFLISQKASDDILEEVGVALVPAAIV